MTIHVRWPAKTSGAFGLGCPFLCYFLLGKQKKVNDTSRTIVFKGIAIKTLFLTFKIQINRK